MTPFKARVAREGSKNGRRITVPAQIVAQLRATGFNPPGWARVTLGHEQIFVQVRWTIMRPSASVTLPGWVLPEVAHGDEIEAQVEDATPFRARENNGDTWPGLFDWLPFVDPAHLPTETPGGVLVIHSKLEAPFEIFRKTDRATTENLLGYYTVHGSLSAGATNFTFTERGDDYCQIRLAALESLGITPERISIVQPQPNRSVIRVLKSRPLLQMVRNWIAASNPPKRGKDPGVVERHG